MSLQVWLPLNGDLRNQGLSTLSFNNISSANTTIDNDGKIGKCYSNNSHTAGGLISDETIELGQQQSMFCWFKFTDLESAASLGGSLVSQHRAATYTGMGITIRYVSATTGYLSVSTGDGSNRTYKSYYGTTLLQANTWYHGGYTYDGSTIKIYVNGICEKTQAFSGMSVPADYISCFGWNLTGTSGNTVQASYKLQGSLNDVRIYDHCLSETEVKKLAQGLIVHYPLNRHGLGQENLLLNTSTPATWSKTLNDSNYAVNDCFKTQVPVPLLFSTNELITLSFDWTTTATGGNFHVECGAVTPWVWGTVISSKGTRSSASNYIDITSSNKSGHVEITFKITSSQTGAANTLQWFRIRQDGTDTANKTFTISKAKLERGSIATPWSPNSYDSLFEALTYDKTIYTEPDGTQWIRIAHHNNPANALFASTDDFVNSVYKDTNRWYQVEEACGLLNSNEFMVKQKNTSDATEAKFRWIQTKSLLTATYNDVAPSTITKNTTTGYTDGTYGGIYIKGGNARLCIADGTNGDWWGAIGSWTAYHGGIPAHPTGGTVTTGYIDLYIRVDNVNIDGSTEYDCSGFCNNATNFTASEWSSDTPKYSVSTIFDETVSADVSDIYDSTSRHKQLTIATWIKRTSDDANYHYFWESPAIDVGLRAYNGVNNYYLIRWTHSTADTVVGGRAWVDDIIPLNTWVHSVWVFDSGILKHYVNGELMGTRNNSSSGEYIYGSINSTLGDSWQGALSDFRIYATALSAEDVKSLYQNCATIAADGTIYGQIYS